MKIPHLDVLTSAPVGLYPLQRDTQTRVYVAEQEYEGAHSKVFTLYPQNLFSPLAWVSLKRKADEAWCFDMAMRFENGRASTLPSLYNDYKAGEDERPLNLVQQEAVRLLVCEILEGMLAIDTSAPTDAQNYHPWQFLVPETAFVQRSLELSSPVSVPSRAGPPIQKHVYSRVPF